MAAAALDCSTYTTLSRVAGQAFVLLAIIEGGPWRHCRYKLHQQCSPVRLWNGTGGAKRGGLAVGR